MTELIPQYQLTVSARADLRKVAKYTINKWGKRQADMYAKKLAACFVKIAENQVISRNASPNLPDIRCVRCEHHFIFYVKPQNKYPIIIAVLNERMDILNRLKSRF